MSRIRFETPTFEEWLDDVRHCVNSFVGMSLDDLPHKRWRDWYEEGLSPEAAATLALEEEGFDAAA